MKTLQKTYTGKYAPNHLEFDYWIDLTADAKGSVIKTYNGTGWVEISGDSGEQIDAYTKAEVDSKFGETNATVTSIQDTVDLLNMSYFTVYYDVTDISTPTTLFGGSVGSFFSVTRVFIDGAEVDLQSLYYTAVKVCAYTFSKTGTHVVKVYIKDDKSITLSAIWAENKSIAKIDFTGFNPKQCNGWSLTFTNSSLSEIVFPKGFYFHSTVQAPFASTQIKQFDLSNFDPQQLMSVDFLYGSNVQSLVMRGITTQHSFSIPGGMSTLREVIIKDCDIVNTPSLFLYAAQMTSLQKIDFSGSKLKIYNETFVNLPATVTELIFDNVDATASKLSASTPFLFGSFSGVLDFSKCKFDFTNDLFTNFTMTLPIINAPNSTGVIWDGLEITVSNINAPFAISESNYISLRNSKLNITSSIGILWWYNRPLDVDLTGSTISGNINGLCTNHGKTILDRVVFTDATWAQAGPPVFAKSSVDLSTASGKITGTVNTVVFAYAPCTVYYNATNLDLTDVISNAQTRTPGVRFVDTQYGESAPWKLSQLYDDTIGCTAATTTASLVTDKNLVVAKISANDTFSLASVPAAGKEIHTIVKNSGNTDVVVTIPTLSPYVNLSGDSFTVVARGYLEINAISDGTNIYIRIL